MATTYTFTLVPTWGAVGSLVRRGTGGTHVGTVTDPGGVSVTVVQSGVTQAGYLLPDPSGTISFTTTDVPTVLVDFGAGPVKADAANAITENMTAAANAASSAASASSSASSAAASAALVGAPAGAAVDAALAINRAPGSGDSTTALNSFLSNASPLGVKKLIGTFTVSGTLTFPGKNLDLTDATINHTVTGASVLVLSGDNATLAGGTFNGPSAWDGTNSEWLYSAIHATGANPTVRGVTLNNVQRVGIGFKNASGLCRALDVNITGNYPAGSWTEVETMHCGVAFDPAVGSVLEVRGGSIKSCVQLVFMGNYGAGSSVGSIIDAVYFEGAHNHCVYGSTGVDSVTVSNCRVVNSSRPFVLTGDGHTIDNCSATTTLSSGNLAEVASLIQIRNATRFTITRNKATGLVHATVPCIDVSRLGAGTTIHTGVIEGNEIEVTGTNSALCLRVGSGAETTFRDIHARGNVFKGPGVANQGVVSWFGATGSQAYGCSNSHNDVIITGPANGIHVSEQLGLDLIGNKVRLEYSSPSAVTLGGIVFTGNTKRACARHNEFYVSSAFGTNVTFRAIWEVAGTTENRIGPNRYNLDATLATVVTHVIQVTSGTVLTEVGMTGAPTTVCGPGSTWTRADGGTNTTFYVKESAASSGTWTPK